MNQKLRIETGHSLTKDIRFIDATRVRFVAPDGHTMFEVSANKDGKSIEVRGVEPCKVGDVLFSETLLIEPRYSNAVNILTKEYK